MGFPAHFLKKTPLKQIYTRLSEADEPFSLLGRGNIELKKAMIEPPKKIEQMNTNHSEQERKFLLLTLLNDSGISSLFEISWGFTSIPSGAPHFTRRRQPRGRRRRT